MKNITEYINLKSIAFLLIGLLLGWLIFTGSGEEINYEKAEEHGHESAEEVYTCSMHPSIRQSEPGDCPICGMDLVPLENDNTNDESMGISMSENARKLADVRTLKVTKNTVNKKIRLDGRIEMDERLVFTQSSHIPGRIEDLQVNFTGEYIKKGQVIAYIYSPELVNAQEELFEAKKIQAGQPGLYQAAVEKLRNWKLENRQIQRILELNRVQEIFPILADTSGTVIRKMVQQGDYIHKGQSLYDIVDLNRVWLLLDVYESDMAWLNVGDSLAFTVNALPGRSFTGNISYIDPVIDPRTRVAKARAEIENTDDLLKPEMFVSAVIQAGLPGPDMAVAVPKSAVMWTGKRSFVYVRNESRDKVQFTPRQVTLGPDLGDSFIIENGLSPGEIIAYSGTFSIDAAAQLAAIPSMMDPEGNGPVQTHDHGNMPAPPADDHESQDRNDSSDDLQKEVITLGSNARAALSPLYDAYFLLKDALVADDPQNAARYMNELKDIVNSIDMSLFEGQAHTVWMETSVSIKNNINTSDHGTENIETLRRAFQRISDAMINLNEKFGSPEGVHYVQFCPMADNNKGADWLSRRENIENPYFGASMLSCGELVKTIPVID